MLTQIKIKVSAMRTIKAEQSSIACSTSEPNTSKWGSFREEQQMSSGVTALEEKQTEEN